MMSLLMSIVMNMLYLLMLMMRAMKDAWSWKFQVDDLLVDVPGNVWVDAHNYGYDGLVSPENFWFLWQLIAVIWSFIHIDIGDVHCFVNVFCLGAQHDGYDGWVDPEN